MGNKIARTTQASASEYYLHELPSSLNLVLKEVVGRGRFLKSIQCMHDEGLLLVKVYFKRGGDSLHLKEYERRLCEIKERLQKIKDSHVWPFQCWLETEKAAYLIRQYFFSNLHDRLSTRPFLNNIEKKWIAFQLLYALKQSHEHGVCHGDIKCENVLLTSWNWVYLADYASFKPTYIPDDDPSDFSFFFDTGGRRRCYLAPERFHEPGGDGQLNVDTTLKPSMDIFSLGCVIAELFLEGQSLFELSQLLAYRRGQYDPGPYLEKISDDGIRSMILHMIQLDPEARLSCDSYLQNYAYVVFPSNFPFFHNLFSWITPLDTDKRVAVIQSAFPEILKQMAPTFSEGNNALNKASSTDANQIAMSAGSSPSIGVQENLKGCFDKNEQSGKINVGSSYSGLISDIGTLQRDLLQPNCEKHTSEKAQMDYLGNSFMKKNEDREIRSSHEMRKYSDSLQLNANRNVIKKYLFSERKENKDPVTSGVGTEKNAHSVLVHSDRVETGTKCDGMVLIASLLCACVRSGTLTQSRRGAILLLLRSSYYIDDEDRLQHVLPYVIAMLSDPAAIVRCAALQTVCDVLSLVNEFPPSDAKIFPEYILPMLSTLPDDPEESVRICYANNIYKIAATASHFLIRSQVLNEADILDRSNISHKAGKGPLGSQASDHRKNSKCNAELTELRQTIAHVIQELVMGPKQSPIIRRALLEHIKELCDFFGKKQTNDFLLPILPAFLNDRDEQLRAVFFEQIIHVCYFVGQISVEQYLFPYIEQALNDVVEEVIVNALKCLAALSKSKLLGKLLVIGSVEHSAPLLCHPSQWVRRAAVIFIAAGSESLQPVNSYVYLSPILLPFLRREPASLTSEIELLSCLKSPMSRKTFHEVLEKAKNSQCLEVSEKGNNQSKVKQLPDSQKLVEPSLNSNNAPFLNKKIHEKISSISSVAVDPAVAKSWLINKSYLHPNIESFGQNISLSEPEDCARMKAMESYILNLSSTMQSRENTSELENHEKLQASGLGMPVNSGTGNGSNHGPSYDGVPIYVYPLNEMKNESGKSLMSSIGSSLNEELSKDVVGPQGATPILMTNFSGAQVAGSVVSSQWTLGAGHSSMPAAEMIQKSVSMVGSFPPKLVSGSILNGSFASTRQANKVLRDSAGRENDDITYMMNKFKDIAISDDSKSSLLSMSVTAGSPSLTDATVMSSYSGSSVPDRAWRPRGILVAHLQEHQLAVNDIAVSHDHNFFVSASDDCTVKIWDSRRLEKDITFRSRLTYSVGDGRALHVAMFANGPQVAVASSSGRIHVFSVNYLLREDGSIDRYTGTENVAKKETKEGAVLSLQKFSTEGPPMILYSTQHNGIHLWDLRAQINAWTLKASPKEGYISAVVVDPFQSWLVSGSSRGVLTLWDVRFHIPVNTWQHPMACSIEKMCLHAATSNSFPCTTGDPLVYVAAGINEVALWNAKDGSCQKVFRLPCSEAVADVSEIPAALARSSQSTLKSGVALRSKRMANSKYGVDELNEPPPRLPGIRSLLPLSGGDLLTGGTDLRIRLWNHFRPERSYCVCGPPIKKTAGEEYYDTRSVHGVQVVQETNRHSIKLTSKASLAAAATDSAGCHRDSILSMASIQLNQKFLISSSRDGAVKVWK
ncbi:hypothetical protein SUGI_0518430 [Cryptomeria japonica]|uniref:serine/threonine-protein kinase VPS15 n=1 Tax=Cryptomeria japonica TaxID=3369 RepID=UPI002408A885|nr:serine/threonine-protein kinase VPS15 [Cryptomeria japonica]GLJ26656.1 hypothetical protein SUGI_0518430 [Cryptomeria japonica]